MKFFIDSTTTFFFQHESILRHNLKPPRQPIRTITCSRSIWFPSKTTKRFLLNSKWKRFIFSSRKLYRRTNLSFASRTSSNDIFWSTMFRNWRRNSTTFINNRCKTFWQSNGVVSKLNPTVSTTDDLKISSPLLNESMNSTLKFNMFDQKKLVVSSVYEKNWVYERDLS